MPNPLKQRLSDYLNYGNEFSLRKRLKQLLNGLREATRKKITPKEEGFVDSVVCTRNYLTHYNEELKDKATTDLESQFNLNGKLRALISILLLREAGLSEDVIAPRILGARS
jgi:hypothetical protein